MFDDLRNIADDQANFGSDSDAELAPLLDKKVQIFLLKFHQIVIINYL